MIIKFSKDFEKAVRKQSGKILQSIKTAIIEVKQAKRIEELTDCKKLVGYQNVYRLRIADLRAFFVLSITVDKNGEYTIIFEYLVSRGEAYSKRVKDQLKNKDS